MKNLLPENTKKTCKSNNYDLNHDWKKLVKWASNIFLINSMDYWKENYCEEENNMFLWKIMLLLFSQFLK